MLGTLCRSPSPWGGRRCRWLSVTRAARTQQQHKQPQEQEKQPARSPALSGHLFSCTLSPMPTTGDSSRASIASPWRLYCEIRSHWALRTLEDLLVVLCVHSLALGISHHPFLVLRRDRCPIEV